MTLGYDTEMFCGKEKKSTFVTDVTIFSTFVANFWWQVVSRYRQRLFVSVGHETTYASSENLNVDREVLFIEVSLNCQYF